MFRNSWHTKCYFTIVQSAKSRDLSGYCERHHIIPKALGGNNEPSNMVKLTAREHFVCHKLLTKMTIDPTHKRKMCFAAHFMSHKIGLDRRSRRYEFIKREMAKAVSSIMVGINKTEQAKAKMKASALKNKQCAGETGEFNRAFKGWYVTPWGKFASAFEADKAGPEYINRYTIYNYCKYPDRIVTKETLYRSLYMTEAHIGKSFREVGFYFIKKEH